MPRDCDCCGGTCGPAREPSPAEVSRRDFLRFLGVGAVALYGELALPPAYTASPRSPGEVTLLDGYGDYPLTAPRLYSGEHLGAVAMPIGGIGTGTIWLDGQGRLGVWQIFNNGTEPRVPGSFLAMRVQPEGEPASLCVLQTEPEPGFAPCAGLTFEGGYPVARLNFDTGLPVSARVEAFSPMIPTDVANSSLPCVVLRVTATNAGDKPAEVSLLATLQNAVGYEGNGTIEGVHHPGFGGNGNRVVREGPMTALAMTTPSEPPWTGFLRVRHSGGRPLGTDPVLWLGVLDGPGELARAGAFAMGGLDALSRLAERPAVIVSAGATQAFFEALSAARTRGLEEDYLEVFEDFEGSTYEGWTVEGEAFGTGPSGGTHPGQQAVSGFQGRGMVNTFLPNDGPQGRLVSRPFTIRHNHIGFLLGGGNHPGQTCMNLWVAGEIVRSAHGRDNEALEPQAWDVADLLGKEATLEIVDARSDGWGHVNVDHIVFGDVSPDNILRLAGAFGRLARRLPLRYDAVTRVDLEAPLAPVPVAGGPAPADWQVSSYLRLEGLHADEGELTVLAFARNGDPLLLQVEFGKAVLVLSLAPDMPWAWARELICHVSGLDGETVRFETTRGGFGSMALASTGAAKAVPGWTDGEDLARRYLDAPAPEPAGAAGPTPGGSTINGALAIPFRLAPGQSHTESFVITWHFPNVERFGHQGNHYCGAFADALQAARYVTGNLRQLTDRTLLYHRTLYQSNLPEEFLDALSSQSVILRGPTCWRSEAGYFGGYEGAYGCCPLNCTHVWNYAQTHARLFPEIGRNMRISDFITYLHDDGETSHRQHAPHDAFADGHCACIQAALREHQLSVDDRFLRRVYPGVKKAMDWFIARYDKAEEGVTRTHQWNTYDTAVSGLNTFIGSQYLGALAAAAAMAREMGEAETAGRWEQIGKRGSARQDAELWSGEYYIQKPETPPAHDYNGGCHSDQLLGQWWAHQLGLGYLYPEERVKAACRAIHRHNLKPDFTGLEQTPRRYVDDGDGGLYMCTWPGDDRPDPFTLYSVEVWTGVEYSTAGLMVYEGLLDEARQIVGTARARYDGRPRRGLNSGGGVCGMGNPFQELECGKFYARAMSSWSLLTACQGQILHGPAGLLGFSPRWRPEDHRSFFTVPEGWGLFCQTRAGGLQTERIELRHGKLTLRKLVLDLGTSRLAADGCRASCNGRPIPGVATQGEDALVVLELVEPLLMTEGQALEVTLRTTG